MAHRLNERKRDAAGVDVTLVRYSLNPFSQIPTVRSALRQATEELKLRLK